MIEASRIRGSPSVPKAVGRSGQSVLGCAPPITTGESSTESLSSVSDRNFEAEHRELRQIVPTTVLGAAAIKQETTAVHSFLIEVYREWGELPLPSSDAEHRHSIEMSRSNTCVD